MRDRPTKFNDTLTEADEWWEELERFEPCQSDFDSASCAELAEELDLYRVLAEEDVDFLDRLDFWDACIWEHSLWVALEQCCHDGVLFPAEQRALRLKGCPQKLREKLDYFLSRCPSHVMHRLALHYFVLVRLVRANRTGNPEWRPDKPPPKSPYHDTVFFRPPILKYRNYAR
jgi:hypothetical protein